jgi:RNA-directed DNA polymerase
MLREKSKWKHHEDLSTNAEHRGGATCSSDEGSVMDVERRGCIVQLILIKQPEMEGFNGYSKVV